MKSDRLLNTALRKLWKHGVNIRGGGGARGAAAVSRRLGRRRDTGRAEKFLITIKTDVVDAHFTGLNTIHYLLEVLVFDL